MKLIGVAGAKRVGKDTFYSTLKARGKPVQRIAFADHIKADCSHLQGLEGASKEDIRPVLQAYGEAVKAAQGSRYWIDRLEAYLPFLHVASNDYLILTDVRFVNEADWVRSMGGYLVTVTRPGMSSGDDHISESEWANIKPNAKISNHSTRELYVEAILKEWRIIERFFEAKGETDEYNL